MLMRKVDIQCFCFGDVPVDLLALAFAFVPKGVFGSFFKPVQHRYVSDARFFSQFPAHGGLAIAVVRLHVALGKVPVALRVLKEQHGPVIDQHHPARGLHVLASRLLVHGHNGC